MGGPRVSVCIPTRNGAPWIQATLRSVLAQGEELDIVVSDDASTDATVELARSIADARLRVVENPGRLGMASNWNRAVELSDGEYVKLLLQDDELLPGTLSVQASLLDRHPSAAFAFGPRVLETDGSPDSERWRRRYEAVHAALVSGDELVPGQVILATLTRGRLRGNAIGEPSAVLIRRASLARSGLFDPGLRQLTDLDLWVRLAGVGDAAFDPRPVARFRVHAHSATARNRETGDAWLDRLRIVDQLRGSPRTRERIGVGHYAAAVAAGLAEVARPVLTGRRSIGAVGRDLRDFARGRRSRPGSVR